MSLLRLLTTGKSLVGVNETESRYRLTRQRLLPQFGPTRNPFENKGKSDPRPAAGSPGDPRVEDASRARHESPALGGTPAAAPQPMAERRTLSAGANRHSLAGELRLKAAGFLSRWGAKLSRLPKRPIGKATKPAIPGFTKPPVQEELSLDRIKVVRNDLSDADLEVVPTPRPADPASAAPTTGTDERPGPEQGAWGKVAARMFGPGKS